MILGIDTTGEACSVALLDQDLTLVASNFRLLGSGHAEALFPMMEEMFEEAGASRNGVSRIIVTTGPGSFTGVRVGVSAAKGLGLGLSCPVQGISVLQLLAAQAFGAERALERLMVANDARRSQVYIQSFERLRGGQFKALEAARVTSLDELNGLLVKGRDQEKLLIGSAAGLVSLDAGSRVEARQLNPDMAALGDVLRLIPEEYYSDQPQAFYLRPPDAKPQAAPAWQQKEG